LHQSPSKHQSREDQQRHHCHPRHIDAVEQIHAHPAADAVLPVLCLYEAEDEEQCGRNARQQMRHRGSMPAKHGQFDGMLQRQQPPGHIAKPRPAHPGLASRA